MEPAILRFATRPGEGAHRRCERPSIGRCVNLILLFERDFVDPARSRVRLEGRRARHVRKVLRAQPGEVVTVGVEGGAIGVGLVLEVDREAVMLDVALERDPPPPLDVVLVLALPRPPVLRRTLAAATSIGVARIELVDAARVEQSFWQSHAVQPEAIEEQLVLGVEQARDTRLPAVTLHRRLSTFVDDVLPGLVEGRTAWLADPAGGTPPTSPWPQPGLVAIGPEGGWVDDERASLARAGLGLVALGDRAVRVETAVPLVLGRYL